MERPLIAVGASVFLHALAWGAVVTVSAVLAPATTTPPRVLYMILPEPDAAGPTAENHAPVESRARDGMSVTSALKARPQAPREPGETISAKPEPPSVPAAPSSLEETEAARPIPRRVSPPTEFVPLALASGVAAAPDIAKPAARSGAGGESDANPTDGRAEAGHTLGESALRGASMGSPRDAGTGSVDSGLAGQGGELVAALPPGGPIALAVPRYDDNPKPAYPWRARLRGEQGTVRLLVRVSERGHTSDVRVSRSSGSELLDEAALTAVRRWIFHPGRRGDRPVDMWVQVPILFRLEGR